MAHLREPGEGEQPTTAVELFFDLVYVFAVTQLSHLLLHDLTWAGAARTAFLLRGGLVGVDLHHLDGQLVRPGLDRGATGADPA